MMEPDVQKNLILLF